MYAFLRKHKGWTLLSLLTVFLVSIVIVACSSDNGSGNNGGGGGNNNTITVGDNFFSPSNLTIPRGTMVTWNWQSTNNHTVTSGTPSAVNAGSLFDRGPMNSGSFQFMFNDTGVFPYF